jgi:O-antigen ligase
MAVLLIATIPTLRRQWKELTDPREKTTIPLDRDASLGTSWGGMSIRKAIWKCSGDLVRRHWLTGVGTGDIQDSLQQAYENRQFYFASRYNHYNAHSQFLQTLIGHGAGGLSILLLCIFVPLGRLVPRIRALTPTQTCYLAFLSLFCVLCFTEVILDINKGVILYSFFNSIFGFASPLQNTK